MLPEPHEHAHWQLFTHHGGVGQRGPVRRIHGVRRQEQHRGRFQPRGLSHGDDRQVPERLRRWARLYAPPGWDQWFAAETGDYYDYGITTNDGLLHFGTDPQDYITRVLSDQARAVVADARASGDPFFLYYAFTAPHGPSTPDPRDIGRFDSVDTGLPHTRHDMLNAAYGVDRAIGQLLKSLPGHTLVIYMSDNGYLWGEPKGDHRWVGGKGWPYNESIRYPWCSPRWTGRSYPRARAGDLVLNVDLRPSLTHAAGIERLTEVEGKDWFRASYAARHAFPLEHWGTRIPPYCGVRESELMYVRFLDGTERCTTSQVTIRLESPNLVGNPTIRRTTAA